MNTSRKSKRRTQKQQEEDAKKIFKRFARGPLHSQYKAFKDLELKEIASSTLRRDLVDLQQFGYLKVDRGPRKAKTYSLTFKGLLFGLKIGAFDLAKARDIRIINKIKFPIVKTYLPIGNKGIKELRVITTKMEELEPKAFYSIIRKFDINAAPRGLPAWACILAGVATLTVKYLLDPEAVGPYLKGTKAALKLKDGTKWIIPEDFPLLLSLVRPLMPEEIQRVVDKRLKDLGFAPNDSEEFQDIMRKIF